MRYNVTIDQLRPERIDTAHRVQRARLVARGLGDDEVCVGHIAPIATGRPEELGDRPASPHPALSGHLSGRDLQLGGVGCRGAV